MRSDTPVECLTNMRAIVGESPIWDHRTGKVVWVDILGRKFHSTDPNTGDTESLSMAGHTAAVALYGESAFILAVQGSVVGLHEGSVISETEIVSDATLRFNDGKVDPAGRFLVGTMDYHETPRRGKLYQIGPDGKFRIVLEDVTISNGLAWSPCGRWLYYVDSGTSSVDRFKYDVDTGKMTDRQRLIDIEPNQGIPDGITVDNEGCIWIALFGGGMVRRYSPRAKCIETIHLPTPQVTSCAFGGPDMDQLYITSATYGLASAQQDHGYAGGLFVVSPGCKGDPEPVIPWINSIRDVH